MPGGQPIRLGPFIGGLNTASDPTAIADSELAECMNFELDIDGSLVSRIPFKELAGHAGWTERILLLGEAIFSGSHYVIGSNTNGVYYYLSGTWTLITNTFQASVAIQYADKVYLVAKPGSGNGGKWDPVGGFTAVAAIPKGQAAVIHKERLFIAPGIDSATDTSRLKFSDSGNFDSWPAGNFVDISPGDGSKLIDLTVFQDNLIIFKQHSTYVLAYDVRPADAVVRKISLTIGVNAQFNMVNYENQVYIFHEGWVYEIINYDFHRINTKVPFVRDGTVPGGSSFADEDTFISIVEDRLICRFLKKIYIYGLRTRTWSEWESSRNELHYFGPIVTIHPSTGHKFYGGSCLGNGLKIIEFQAERSASTVEQTISVPTTNTITCYAKTKNFDMAISHQFKRLWYWGADVTTGNNVIGTANNIILSFNVTWDQVSAFTWDQISVNTWDQPLSSTSVIQTTATTGAGIARRFIKFDKSLRYRQINFKVQLTTNGSTSDGPARIFTMTALTESKQVVSKSVN